MKRIKLLAFLLFPFQLLSQSSIEQLEPYIIPFQSVEESPEIVNGTFSDVRLVGLGEATHGSSEFFTIKADLVKQLILQEGFNTIIFEGSYANSTLLDQYITSGEGNVFHALIGLGPWCWYTQEILDLIEWLKEYNADKSTENKVRLYGCDMQILKFTIDGIIGYLEQQNQLGKDLRQELIAIKAFSNYRKLKKKEEQSVQNVLKNLRNISAQMDSTSTEEQGFSHHHIRVLEQWLTRISTKKGTASVRDEFMAENVRHILSLKKKNKGIIWAHNAHIALQKDDNQQHIPMGKHLAEYFGEGYYAMGFGFNKGSFHAISENTRTAMVQNADEDSSDYQMAQGTHNRFFLNIRSMEDPTPLTHQPTKSRNIGERYYPGNSYRYHTLANSYSGFIFVQESTASQLLDFSLIR